MNSILQILKVNEARDGETDGRKWQVQDAECVILDADGQVDQVGVLMIPKELRSGIKPGTFLGTFALRASTRRDGQRRIEAVLTGLQPYARPVPKSA